MLTVLTVLTALTALSVLTALTVAELVELEERSMPLRTALDAQAARNAQTALSVLRVPNGLAALTVLIVRIIIEPTRCEEIDCTGRAKAQQWRAGHGGGGCGEERPWARAMQSGGDRRSEQHETAGGARTI